MRTFQQEFYDDVVEELAPLLKEHHEEVGLNIPLDPDLEVYRNLEGANSLRIFTQRENGQIVGYAIVFLRWHHHYKTKLFGLVDVLYLDPKYRKGPTGMKLIRNMERYLQDDGVEYVTLSCKLPEWFMDHLGYTPVEVSYCKELNNG